MQLLIFFFSLTTVSVSAVTPPLAGGGLKWTRTIDLTLIRRVL